jgi:hypothetical protein
LIAKRGTKYREIKLHKMAMKKITPQMKGMEYPHPLAWSLYQCGGGSLIFQEFKIKFRIKEPLILGI